jgi:hypothetical protein
VLAGGGDPERDEGMTPARAIRGFDAERDRVGEEIAVVIGEAAGMKGRHGLIEGLGNLRHGGRTDRIAHERGEDRPHAAGAEPAEEHGADKTIHLLGPMLIPGDDGGPEAGIPRPGEFPSGVWTVLQRDWKISNLSLRRAFLISSVIRILAQFFKNLLDLSTFRLYPFSLFSFKAPPYSESPRVFFLPCVLLLVHLLDSMIEGYVSQFMGGGGEENIEGAPLQSVA